MENIELTPEFVEKSVRFANPQYIQVFIYTKYLFERDGEMPNTGTLSAELSIPEDRIKFILGYWLSTGEIVRTEEDGYAFSEKKPKTKQTPVPKRKRTSAKLRPSYKSAEIDAAAERNSVLSGMFYQAETILGHMLSGNEMELLYSFYDWLGLPCEVIVMLLSYAASMGKTGKRYLETMAIDWADRGIDTFDKAEEYISHLEEIHSAEHKIRALLGIYDRALSQTEKKYIRSWTEDMRIDPELVSIAYDRTIENTGKLSWAYMNKILMSWHDAGIKDLKGVEREDLIHSKTKPGDSGKTNKTNKTNKFNNFDDTSKTDYSSLEEKLLDMMLDNE